MDETVGYSPKEIPLVEFTKRHILSTPSETRAKILELYIGLDTPIRTIAIITGVSFSIVSAIISRDFFGVKEADGMMIKLTSKV